MGAGRSRRLAALALLLLVPAPSIGTAMAMWLAPGPIGQAVYGACKVWLVMLPLAWRHWLDREPVSWSPAHRGGLLAGIVLGAIVGALIMAAYALLGRHWIDVSRLHAMAAQNQLDQPERYLLLAVYLIGVNSLLEEYVWRWFVFRKCEILWPRAAVAASAFFFTIHHVVALKAQFAWNVTLLASAGVFAGGVIWSACYRHYRSIWPGYLSHAVVDLIVLGIGWGLINPY